MAVVTNTFDGGTAGNTVTVANSGGASGTAFTVDTLGGAATCTYSTTGAISGLGMRVACAGGTDLYRYRWDFATDSGGMISYRIYFTLNSLPSQAQDLVLIASASGQGFKIQITAANTFRLTNRVGATLGTYGTTLTAGVTYRADVAVKKGTGTGDGQGEARLFTGHSTSALFTYGPVTNIDVGTTDWSQFQLGENISGRTINVTFDDVLMDNTVQTMLGPSLTADPPPIRVARRVALHRSRSY